MLVVVSAVVALEALFVLGAEATARLRSDLRESALLAGSLWVWLAPVAVTLIATFLAG